MNLKLLLLLLCLVATPGWSILPLPYPLTPISEELEAPDRSTRDPKSIEGYLRLHQGSKAREMELPSFESQPGALGYDESTFKAAGSLKNRIDFWKKIYAEYTRSNVVIHDTKYPWIIYEVVDVSEIQNNDSLSERRKRRLIHRFIKPFKKKVKEKLLFLHTHRDDPLNIPVDLFPIFKAFGEVTEKHKFLMATQRIRSQSGQREAIVQGFFYGGRYFSKMMEIFERKRLPKEITRLPLVESAFDIRARSKVGASGVWQFMPSTGKRYLRIDRLVDERNDPLSATWAASDLLQKNYEVLGSWPLAITAYNHGRAGMQRAKRSLNTDDLATIIDRYQSRTFGFASSNFYACFLAILDVEREYRKYFGKLMVDSPIEYEEFLIGDHVQFDEMADVCGVDREELAMLNLALTDRVLTGKYPVPPGYRLKVPPGKSERCQSGYINVTKMDTNSNRSISSK